MSEALFSPSWYRVAALAPRLRSHAQLHRHQYRGQTWYVLQDQSNERYHRFSPAAYAFIGLMDGQRTVQEIWELVSTKLGDDAPTQPQVVQLLSQLHATDVLQCDIPPDIAELLHRHERTKQKKWQRKLMNVFAWQFPLFDPERLLQTFVPLVRPFFGWGGALVWLAIVIPGVLIGATHWSDLTANLIDQISTPQNLVLLWFLFPIIKALHEFGHAFAVKAFGGEVHEMGIMLLVFSPVPYVDASASSAFSSKWQRAVVGAAGMIVELVLASIAIFVWVSVEPGVVRTLAYNTIMIAGISTVLFNGNPLLRFDGYHMLADLTEIPNLGQRANKYIGYLCERYPFGCEEAQVPHATPGERVWFVGYSVSAFLYRVFIVFVILMYLTDQWFALGMFFAAVTAVTWFLIPLGKGLSYLFTSARIRRVRGRAIAVTSGTVAVIIAALCLTPVPFRTRAEGVVWIPDEAIVRAGADGFVEKVVGIPGSKVLRGDVLVVCKDSVLTAQLTVLEARLREINARIREQILENLVKAKILEEEKRYVEEKLARTREQVQDLVITAKVDGVLVVSRVDDLPGRFVHRGDVLAHVVDLNTLTVRTVVDQTDIDLIRHSTNHVQVRLAERLVSPIEAGVTRLVPAASDELPSPALGSDGGGQVQMDPKDPKGQKALRKVFQMDLQLPVELGVVNVGGRVYVRFDHGWAPLMAQWYRQGRQLFLSRFNV